MQSIIDFVKKKIISANDSRNGATNVNSPTGMQIAVWVIIVITSISVSLFNYQTFQIGSWGDDLNYAILARSLVDSDKFGIISVPGNEPFPAPYPFGYPLIIAPFAYLFPENLDALKIPSLIANIVNISILFWGWRLFSRRSHWLGLAVIGLYAVHPQTIWHSRMVLSEPVFITFYLLVMVLAAQAARGDWNWWRRLLMGLFLTFLIFTRTIGIVFGIGVFLYLLIIDFRKFFKEIFIVPAIMLSLVIGIVAITPVQLTNLVPARYLEENSLELILSIIDVEMVSNQSIEELLPSRYVRQFGFDPSDENAQRTRVTFLERIRYVIFQNLGRDFRWVVLPHGGGSSELAIVEKYGLSILILSTGFVFLILLFIGFVRWFMVEGITIFNLSVILYLIALLFWWWDGPRFLFPIQFQLYYALFLGIEFLWISIAGKLLQQDMSMKLGKGILLLTVISLVAIYSYKSLTIEDTRLHLGDLSKRTIWTKTLDVSSNAIIMTEEPTLDFAYGGKKTMPYPESYSGEKDLREYLERYLIDYVLVAPKRDWYPHYIPNYSETTTRMLSFLDELESENYLTQVYSEEEYLLKVYEILP